MMCGLSAGSLCWFEQGLTAFHGEEPPRRRARAADPGSNAVHYDKEPRRRPDYHAAVAAGMAPGWAADDGAALHFVGCGSRGSCLAPARERLPGRSRGRRGRRGAAGGGVPGGAGVACRLRGARRRSSRWAAAASRWSPRRPCSTTTCSRSPPRASRASASCRRRAATPRSRSAASRSRSATGCASPAHVSLFRLGHRPMLAARPPARPGHHLRRRRLDDQPARAVARPRARRDPARGVAGRDRARRD